VFILLLDCYITIHVNVQKNLMKVQRVRKRTEIPLLRRSKLLISYANVILLLVSN